MFCKAGIEFQIGEILVAIVNRWADPLSAFTSDFRVDVVVVVSLLIFFTKNEV